MNYLDKQYKNDKKFKIKHNYLSEQFRNVNRYLKRINNIVKKNSFTLGKEVREFENIFKKNINSKYAIGVSSGTDAIALSLRCLNIGYGDEVIVPSFTFYASVNPIVSVGAIPVFVDIKNDFNMDEKDIEKRITKKTKAILAVHWAGRICEMEKLKRISSKYKLKLVEDSCHAYLAKYKNKFAGNLGHLGCFSLHPLKNVNVWGDGGMIVTNNKKYYKKILLLRNHGLVNRDQIEIFGQNSRLDTIQAAIGIEMIKSINQLTKKRIKNAKYLDIRLSKLKQLNIPKRKKKLREVFQFYCFLAKNRNRLKKFLNKKGIDAKIHYPIPMHMQKPSSKFGYRRGMFKMSENISKKIISLPVHEFVKKSDLDYMINSICKFYSYT